MAWWGEISVTSGGPLLDIPPTGLSASLPAFSVFEFCDQQLTKERFSFDLNALCDGLGLSYEAVGKALLPFRTQATG